MNKPQAGGGGGVVVDSEALARARYFAYAQRRSMPPRCNPFGILLLVLSLGMVFIGLTMTIIANWPGATSIGENPLKIAGPVLLGVGGALFILGVILIIYLNKYEEERWERRLTNLAADRLGSSSKEILVQRAAPVGLEARTYKRQPGDGSASTTGGKYGAPKEDPSSSRSSSAYAMKGRYSSSTVEMLPDPTRKPDTAGKLNSGSIDSIDKVPDPMRIQKKRNTPRKSGSSNGSVNTSYNSSAGEADLGIPGMLMPSRSSQPSSRNNVYSNDVYESEEIQYDVQAEKKDMTDATPRRTGKSSKEGKGQRQQRQNPAGASDPIREAIARGTAHMYNSPDPQQLRVHIKAQPGTAIIITPSATPPSSRRSPHQRTERQSLDTSGETEI